MAGLMFRLRNAFLKVMLSYPLSARSRFGLRLRFPILNRSMVGRADRVSCAFAFVVVATSGIPFPSVKTLRFKPFFFLYPE